MIGHPLPVAKSRGCSNFLGVCLRPALAILISFCLTGCISKRSAYDIPDVALPSAFKNQPAESHELSFEKKDTQAAITDPRDDALLVEWWRSFGSRELDSLINRGLANNPDVRIATIQLSQAKARADQAKAGLLPNVAIPATIARQAPGGTTVGAVPVGSSSRAPATSIQSSLRGDFRLDIWGEQSALAESAQMQLWRAAYERDNVQRNVTATIAANYVEFAALNDRLRIAKETERVLSETLLSVEKRVALGDATVGDLEQQKAVVYGLRAAIPGMQQQREDAINTLAFMVGTLPGNLSLSEQGLDSLNMPEVVPVLPSSLLLRRPDVRVVEARMLAADADVDVARARILPPLDLAAQAGFSSNMLAQLLVPQAFFWSTVGSLSASIFDGGKRENEKKVSEAVREEMVETYVRVIYQAMREVEGSLASIRLAGKRLDSQREAAAAARRAWEINTKVYAMGGVDHLALLDSEKNFHRYQDDYQRTRMENFRGHISLFQALGGGVKPGPVLPGKGKRPAAQGNLAVMGGSAVNAPERSFSVEGVDWQKGGLANLGGAQVEDFWQIELPGLYHRSTVGAAWRDLRERYPGYMNGRMLRPRLSGRIEEGSDGQQAWYRLYVAKFVKESEANAFCNQLMANQERCKVVYSRPDERPPKEVEILAKVDDSSAVVDSSAGEESVPDKSELLEEANPLPVAVDEHHLGQSTAESRAQQGYTIQLGAFSNLENAQISSSVWKFRGYSTDVAESIGTDGRIWYTVRTGAFKSRSEGAVVAQKIRRKEDAPALLIPAVVDFARQEQASDAGDSLVQNDLRMPPAVPEPPEPVAPSARVIKVVNTQSASYTVQLGAFSAIENARLSQKYWQDKGMEVFLDTVSDADGRPWFAVRTGRFSVRREAAALALQMGRKERVSALVVPVNQFQLLPEEEVRENPLSVPLKASFVNDSVQPPVRYTVQLGAFSSIENAATSFANWRNRGYEPYVCETDDVRGNLRFAVRIGEFSEKREAQQVVRSIQRQEGTRSVLVPAITDKLGALIKIDVTPLLPNLTLDSPPVVEELSSNDVR